MTDETGIPDPPVDLPPAVADTLRAHATDGHALREAIVYAQELLRARHEPLPRIEAREGEEIVRMRERDGYTEVVKRHGDDDAAYLYHVSTEPTPEGDDHLHWTLIGREDERDDATRTDT